MKANHNLSDINDAEEITVSNGSKILKWKQITTAEKAVSLSKELFPMVQRY